MSEERDVIVIEDGKTESRKLTQDDVKQIETREQKRARYARVLERGFIVDRCTVENLPPTLHGEWVPRDPIEIERKLRSRRQSTPKTAALRSMLGLRSKCCPGTDRTCTFGMKDAN